MKHRILIVEDDSGLQRVLRDNLSFEGFDVAGVGDGNAAVSFARSFAPDLAIVDITLPGRSGLELCRLWRQAPRIPTILLTARSDRKDKVVGLKMGADDYVTKPFDLEELIARVYAVLRRVHPPLGRLQLGQVTVDFDRLHAWSGGTSLDLSYREFLILRYLAEHSERVVYRDELLQQVCGYAETSHTRAIDHAIARLRRKVEPDPHHPQFIHTAYGDGYTLTASGGAAPKPADVSR